jgi:hypothetical protein
MLGAGTGVRAPNRRHNRFAGYATSSRNLHHDRHTQYAEHADQSEYPSRHSIESRIGRGHFWRRSRRPLDRRDDAQFQREPARYDHQPRLSTGGKAPKQFAALHPDQQRFCHHAGHDSESVYC